MQIRVIKSDSCKTCKNYLQNLSKAGISYVTMDGNDPALESQMDEWKISKMPVVQILNKDNTVAFQFQPGAISIKFIQMKIKEIGNKK